MNRKFSLYALAAGALLLCSACEDLDYVPADQLSGGTFW